MNKIDAIDVTRIEVDGTQLQNVMSYDAFLDEDEDDNVEEESYNTFCVVVVCSGDDALPVTDDKNHTITFLGSDETRFDLSFSDSDYTSDPVEGKMVHRFWFDKKEVM